MALNPKYTPAYYFQGVFRDKASGLPLAYGIITFYRDNSRLTKKSVYKLSGTPPNYTYVELPNPCVLSGAGTFVDADGNDCVPYFYPYLGNPEDESAELDLYYYDVYSSIDGGVTPAIEQFTREGQPNNVAAAESNVDMVNYVPNGQFLLHNILPATAAGVTPAYELYQVRNTSASTDIAPGGWVFDHTGGASTKDFVQFERYGSPTTNPSGSPRYKCRVSCDSYTVGDAIKRVGLRFDDVNKFASTTQFYTLSFSGISELGSSVDVAVRLHKYFGSVGGSTETYTDLGTVTLDTSAAIHNISFIFNDNTGKTIGTSDDDYVAIEFDFPLASLFDLSITDVSLVLGQIEVNKFPVSTTADYTYKSLAGFLPKKDTTYYNDNLYLPVYLTPTGLAYDTSQIGKIYATISSTLGKGELEVDGAQYPTAGFSTDLIPYARLQAILYLGTPYFVPKYGTGRDFFTAIYPGSGAMFRITTNSMGATTDASDGTAATGFTFAKIHSGSNAYYVKAYMTGTATFNIHNKEIGIIANVATAGNSGFTPITVIRIGTSLTSEITSITTTAATSLASKYFTFSSYHSSEQRFYVWFKVAGVGTDPAQTGTGIEVDLETADTAAIVAEKIREALNGWQLTNITTVAANSITAGSWFKAYARNHGDTDNVGYYVWYEKGVTTDPAPAGLIGIKVTITAGQTDAQVAAATRTAINMFNFGVPDFRGLILRAQDNSAGVDPDAATRWSLVPGIIGDMVGTNGNDQLLSHSHTYYRGDLPVAIYELEGGSGGFSGSFAGNNIIANGGKQNQVLDTYVRYVIKY